MWWWNRTSFSFVKIDRFCYAQLTRGFGSRSKAGSGSASLPGSSGNHAGIGQKSRRKNWSGGLGDRAVDRMGNRVRTETGDRCRCGRSVLAPATTCHRERRWRPADDRESKRLSLPLPGAAVGDPADGRTEAMRYPRILRSRRCRVTRERHTRSASRGPARGPAHAGAHRGLVACQPVRQRFRLVRVRASPDARFTQQTSGRRRARR
jgi:hypothetical protein